MRKILVFPIHIVTFIIAIPLVLITRASERAKWIDRKINDFELNRKNKRR